MNRIRETIRAQDRTFEDVAADAGLSVKTVYNAADGINSNRSTRKLIALALNTTVDELWPPSPDASSPMPAAEGL